MPLRVQQIWLLFLLLSFTSVQAQVYIGDGVSVQKGTKFVIQNQEVHIDTDEIKGDGSITINHDSEQKITVNQDFKSTKQLDITSQNLEISGKYAQNFELKYLPALTEEVILAKKENAADSLPVRYINIEGLVYDTETKEEEKLAEFRLIPINTYNGFVVTEVMRSAAVDITFDYILPIYSVTLNDERFSDYAELYEFESLTAILKPPIV